MNTHYLPFKKYSVLLLLGLSFCGLSSQAQSTLALEQTFNNNINNGWVKVDRWFDNNTGINNDAFPPDGRGDQSGQRATFYGTSQPSSSKFLLYHASGWNSGNKPTPILLIHGANQDADLAWANPNEADDYGCGKQTCPTTGLMQSLSNDGYKVFALSMPHKNGDGFTWSNHIANAIEVIKQKTGTSKVDLVTWSKSAFNARMYISSLTQGWNPSYRSDVRKLVMLGAPNNGIDWSFRHGWNHTFSVFPQCGGTINGPTAHHKVYCYGVWQEESDWSYSSPYFPGSAQMLKGLEHLHPLPYAEQDWYTTYHGGLGYYTEGNGVTSYANDSLVDTLRATGTDSNVQVYNLCGNQANLSFIHNEHTGPSDGVVFTDSCIDNYGITNYSASSIINVNHLGLGWESAATSKIKAWIN